MSYVASSGPVFYLVGRGWMPWSAHTAIYRPLSPGRDPNALGQLYLNYIFWWYDLGWEHSGRPKMMNWF